MNSNKKRLEKIESEVSPNTKDMVKKITIEFVNVDGSIESRMIVKL